MLPTVVAATAAPASAPAHLDRGDARVSGTISSIAVLTSLAAQLSIAWCARLQPEHMGARMRWNARWASVAGGLAVAALVGLYFIHSLEGWGVVFCLLLPNVYIASSLLQAFIVEATQTEDLSVVGWSSAIFQTIGSLVGSLMGAEAETSTFLLLAALLLLLQLFISITATLCIVGWKGNIEDGAASGLRWESHSYHHLRHRMRREVDGNDQPLLDPLDRVDIMKDARTSGAENRPAAVSTLSGDSICRLLRPSRNISMLLASRFFYECGLAATMVNLYLLEALTGATDTAEAKSWAQKSSWSDAICVAFVSICAARISDRVGRKPIIYGSSALYVGAFIGWPLARGLPRYLFVGVLFGVAHGAQKSVDITLMMDAVSKEVEQRAESSGMSPNGGRGGGGSRSGGIKSKSAAGMVLLWNASSTLGSAVGNWIFGYLWSLGSSDDSSATATTMTLAAALLQYTLPACLFFLVSAAFVWGMRTEDVAAERITVTGGFFDGSPNGYVGTVTVWRRQFGRSVTRLTFVMVAEFEPTVLPVNNKGFGGGCWYNGDLWVCWPNQVIALRPPGSIGLGVDNKKNTWRVCRHIDDRKFNDLHHVDVCPRGIFVANTGFESIDRFSHDGELVSRRQLVVDLQIDPESKHRGGREIDDDDTKDLRGVDAHAERRGKDVLHVNYVHARGRGSGNVDTEGEEEGHTVYATCLKTGRVVSWIEGDDTRRRKIVAQLPGTRARPHEGFLGKVDQLSQGRLLVWNSTVDGRVFASDPDTGKPVHSWDLHSMRGPRGWHRGLVLLNDGFLVGSTVLRGDAISWSTWRFDASESRTGVTFVPYSQPEGCKGEGDPCSVIFLTERNGKIFSLLRQPSNI